MIFLVIYVLLSIALGMVISGLQIGADVKSKPLLIAGFCMGFIATPLLLYGGCLFMMRR